MSGDGMRLAALALALLLVLGACGPTVHGYRLRGPQADETQRVAALLDPLLIALDLPSLGTIATSKGCKIGFAIVRVAARPPQPIEYTGAA